MLSLLASDESWPAIDDLNRLRAWLLNPALCGMPLDLGDAERRAIVQQIDDDLDVLLND